MKYYSAFCGYISEILEMDPKIVRPVIGTLLILIVFAALKVVVHNLVNIFTKDKRDKTYNAYHNSKLIIDVFEVLILTVFLVRYISNLGVFVSLFVSSLTLALKDVFMNIFYGAYIKKHRIFKLEDRIEINGVKGDVINIGKLSFDLLEVQDEVNGQSTGVMITIPNSFLASKHIKNYNKGFRHVWTELKVNIETNSDVENAKETLYEIINSIEAIKRVPVEIERDLANVNSNYRVYYNNCKPIIYTSVTNKCVELKIRYLMDSKKIRNIEDELWIKILESYKKGKLKLYRE